jgi:hypothetical protein
MGRNPMVRILFHPAILSCLLFLGWGQTPLISAVGLMADG